MTAGSVAAMSQFPRGFFVHLFVDDSGQDLVEYALLTTTIGLAGALAWTFVSQAIGGTYSTWVSSVDGLADPPAPSAGS